MAAFCMTYTIFTILHTILYQKFNFVFINLNYNNSHLFLYYFPIMGVQWSRRGSNPRYYRERVVSYHSTTRPNKIATPRSCTWLIRFMRPNEISDLPPALFFSRPENGGTPPISSTPPSREREEIMKNETYNKIHRYRSAVTRKAG